MSRKFMYLPFLLKYFYICPLVKFMENGIYLMKKKSKLSFLISLLWVAVIIWPFQSAMSQLPCTITSSATSPVCYNADFMLSVPSQNGLKYKWSTGDTTSSITVRLTQPADFTVTVTDPVTGSVCSSQPFHMDVRKKINISFKQLQLTCTDISQDIGNTAQVKATASGGYSPSEYRYFWNVKPIQISPGDRSVAVGLAAHQYYSIKVIDPNGCVAQDTFYTLAYPNPVVKIVASPDTAYIQNPHIAFSFENLSEDTLKISNSFWEFDKDPNSYSQPEIVHTFDAVGTYSAYLTVYNSQGCDTLYTHVVDVFPVDLFIPNVFTPNGDGYNDYFVIKAKDASQQGTKSSLKSAGAEQEYKPLNDYYEKTHLVIFNRLGRKVYESDNYKNNWDGGGLPDGTYFYVLKCQGFKDKSVVYKGSVTIFASNKGK